jgi:hypothetical protein
MEMLLQLSLAGMSQPVIPVEWWDIFIKMKTYNIKNRSRKYHTYVMDSEWVPKIEVNKFYIFNTNHYIHSLLS